MSEANQIVVTAVILMVVGYVLANLPTLIG